jgi:hypothetical protein
MRAYHARGAKQPAQNEIVFIFLRDPRFAPILLNDIQLNSKIISVIKEHSTPPPDTHIPLIFTAVGGNAYFEIGLVNDPRPFDFVLRDAPDLPLTPDVDIIPGELVEASLRSKMSNALTVLKLLREQTDRPMYQISAPPPIPSNHYLATREVFAERIRKHGISSPMLRYKVWCLQCLLFKEVCATVNIRFLTAPQEAIDPKGFLRQEGWGADGVHANEWYGGLVLRQIEALASTQLRGAKP